MGVWRTINGKEYKAVEHAGNKKAATQKAKEYIREGKISIRKGGDEIGKGKGYTVWVSWKKPVSPVSPQNTRRGVGINWDRRFW